MQNFVPRNRVGIFRNECSRCNPLDPKVMFSYVSYWLDAFGNVSLPNETRCKLGWNGAINAEVCATKSCRTFRNERSRSTPLDSKLMFWYVSYCSDAFGTVSWAYETRCKKDWNGAINAKVCATELCRNFSQRTLSIHPIGTWTHVWCILYSLGAFGTVLLPSKTR